MSKDNSYSVKSNVLDVDDIVSRVLDKLNEKIENIQNKIGDVNTPLIDIIYHIEDTVNENREKLKIINDGDALLECNVGRCSIKSSADDKFESHSFGYTVPAYNFGALSIPETYISDTMQLGVIIREIARAVVYLLDKDTSN